jgi:hypothetical protein
VAVEAVLLNSPSRNPKVTQRELEALAGIGLKDPKWLSRRRKKKRRDPSMARTKKKVSPYHKRMGSALKKGMTFKQAHRYAKTGRNKPKRRKRRKARRNVWKGQSLKHAAAAVKGHGGLRSFKGTGRYSKKQISRVYKNSPKRRKRRKARRNILTNRPKRKVAKRRKARRNYYLPVGGNRKRRHRRSVARNKGRVKAFTAGVKEVFTVKTLIDGLQITGGGLASVAVPNLVLNSKFLAGKVPAALTVGWGRYLINLVSAGLVSGTATFFGKTKLARNLLLGGVSSTLTSIVADQAVKLSAGSPTAARLVSAAGLSGVGILTQDVEAAVEAAVEEELSRQGVGDYLTVPEVESPGIGGMGDYLVPAETADPTLGIITDYDEGGIY